MTMTDEMPGLGDPVIRRLQQAFVDEDPASDLAAVMQRAARYQAGEPQGAHDAPGHGLTPADLVAARRHEPAAVSRVYTAYAPALFRFFMASLGDHQRAEDLTGTTFVSAMESLPKFRGPVEGLGGWLFQIARHDLYDYRRRQAVEPLEENLGAEPAFGSVPPPPDNQSLALHRLSPQEREILGLLARGWSNRQIAEARFLSLHTVRTHIQNTLVKLGVNSKLEAVSLAFDQGWTSRHDERDPLAMGRLEGADVMAALQNLPAEQREVLLLLVVAGLTTSEVATALGKTVNEVKALRHRGLSSLARALGPQGLEQLQERPSGLGPEHRANQEERHG
jgi:DNA-directed RNA polymerase specialized sigma24 family protein